MLLENQRRISNESAFGLITNVKKRRRKQTMTPENFCYWLQGYIEISRATNQALVITDKEVKVIEDHLKLVFKKETPNRSVSGVELAHGYPIQFTCHSNYANQPNKNSDIFPNNAGIVNIRDNASC